jgi:hypothetical protein
MNQKYIGIIVIVIAVLLSVLVFMIKANDDAQLHMVIEEQGSCYLDDGTCLHEERSFVLYIFGWVLSAALLILGIYLLVFDKTQQILAEQHLMVSSALEGAKKKDEFTAFLSGFEEDEQKVLKSVYEQDGIKQSTLRYKTGLTKSSLSLLLKSLEERDIISRKSSGKTNQVFLRNKF